MQVLKYCLLEYGMGSTAGIVKLRQFYQSYCVFIISFLIFTPEKMLDPVVFFHSKGKETLEWGCWLRVFMEQEKTGENLFTNFWPLWT